MKAGGEQGVITVLAVDDEPLNNELMERAFRTRHDRRLLIATSGPEGLVMLKANVVDVILCDYSMPTMSGVQFLEQAQNISPATINIMVTGYPELREVIDAQSRGLVRHIVAKPWRLKELMDTVDRAVSMRELNAAVSRLKERGPK